MPDDDETTLSPPLLHEEEDDNIRPIEVVTVDPSGHLAAANRSLLMVGVMSRYGHYQVLK